MSEQFEQPIAEWFLDHVRSIRDGDGQLTLAQHRRTLHTIWSRLIIDPMFREWLHVLAQAATLRVGLARAWSEDVAEDVLLRLHKKLNKDLTLGFDLMQGAPKFAPWMRTVLFRQAQHAAKHLRRRMPDAASLSAAESVAEPSRGVTTAIDLAMLFQYLSPEQQAVAHCLAEGDPMTQIARELEFSYKKVRRLVAEIRELLAKPMSDD